jgi:type VI secretion system protein ImpC
VAEEKKEAQQQQAEGQTSLLDEIVAATRLKPSEEAYSITKQGLQAFIDEMLKPGKEVRVTASAVDEMIANLDQKLSRQVDVILHNKDFQQLKRRGHPSNSSSTSPISARTSRSR